MLRKKNIIGLLYDLHKTMDVGYTKMEYLHHSMRLFLDGFQLTNAN